MRPSNAITTTRGAGKKSLIIVRSARPDLLQARWMKPLALVLLVLQLVISIAMLPDSPFAHLAEPTYLAALASIAVTLVLAIWSALAAAPENEVPVM